MSPASSNLGPWVGVVAALVTTVAIVLFDVLQWNATANVKLGLILEAFDRYQSHLDRLCKRGPMPQGTLGFEQTNIPPQPYIHKRLPSLSVSVSVQAPQPDALLLTVTLPELATEGIHALWNSDSIPAGALLRAKGKCEHGTVYWSRIESTLSEDRLQAARWPAWR